MEQQTPVIPTQPAPTEPQQPSGPDNSIGIGIIIGVIVSLAIIGSVYYKIKMDLISSLKTQTQQKTASQQASEKKISQAVQEVAKVTPIPSVTPVTVSSKQDLTTQQTVLDDADLSSVSAALDQNAKDAAQFAP